MLKQSKNPEGYRTLLVYKKADELLAGTLDFTAAFPREKTIDDLEDQMNRSARSVKANIVEGWKRNATHEYYTFLGYSIASNAELLEDYLDISNGHYEAKGIKGAKGGKGREGEKGSETHSSHSSHFPHSTPLAPFSHSVSTSSSPLPLSSSTHFPPSAPLSKSSATSASPVTPSSFLAPSTPSSPFDIHKLRFYPIDPSLPEAVRLFLKAKELNFLLDSLQKSLIVRMQDKKTLSENDRMRLIRETQQKKADEADDWTKSQFTEQGLVLTGQGVKKKTDAERLGLVWWHYGEPEK